MTSGFFSKEISDTSKPTKTSSDSDLINKQENKQENISTQQFTPILTSVSSIDETPISKASEWFEKGKKLFENGKLESAEEYLKEALNCLEQNKTTNPNSKEDIDVLQARILNALGATFQAYAEREDDFSKKLFAISMAIGYYGQSLRNCSHTVTYKNLLSALKLCVKWSNSAIKVVENNQKLSSEKLLSPGLTKS